MVAISRLIFEYRCIQIVPQDDYNKYLNKAIHSVM